MASKPRDRLTKLLERPSYLPPPTREEIVGAALACLHEDLAKIVSGQALSGSKE